MTNENTCIPILNGFYKLSIQSRVYPSGAALYCIESVTEMQLIIKLAGDGKTHYVVEKLKNIPQSHQVTIAINEAFTCLTAIEKLSSLPVDERSCTVFFNFTVFPPIVSLNGRLLLPCKASFSFTTHFRSLPIMKRRVNTIN